MKLILSEEEEKAIAEGKIKAVLRVTNIDSKIGDLLFSVGGVVYVLKDKKHWTEGRCVAQRHSDWGSDVFEARRMIRKLYGSYKFKRQKWLILFSKKENQVSLFQ